MNHTNTINIYSKDDSVIHDIQLWYDQTIPKFSSCKVCSHVNHKRIPVHLIQCQSIHVYSNEDSSVSFFKSQIDTEIGLLCKITLETFILFYYQNSSIMAMILNFSTINQINSIKLDSYTNEVIINNTKPPKRQPTLVTTSVIDKVIEMKRQKSINNPFIKPSTSSPANSTTLGSNSVLSTQDQINTAINKIIFSGLRIRGLTPSLMNSINDKLTIKEIHQMTFKSTLFTLRKHNYAFNKSVTNQLTLNQLQDIVENLLHLYIDLE